MAAFHFEGKVYFYANGKWMDPQSKPVTKEMAEILDSKFQGEEIQKRDSRQNNTKSSNGGGLSGLKINPPRKRHKKAREFERGCETTLSTDQKRALAVLESGENVFLSGEAGTGKSFVLNEYIYRNRKKNIIVCAPTGIAAINVGGTTLHRVFNVPIRVTRPGEYNNTPDDSVVKADVIIIDEISMCRCDIFEYVVRTIKKAEEIQQQKENERALQVGTKPKEIAAKQVIVVGDFFQLAPVITPSDREVLKLYWDMEEFGEGFAFGSILWEELQFKNILLKEIVRQRGNIDFIENLNKIRIGDVSGIQWFNDNTSRTPLPNSIYLCGTNRVADSINEKKSEELDSEPMQYTAVVSGNVQPSDKMTHDALSLKVGMQVMTLVNNSDAGYQNGSLGTIVHLKNESVDIKLNSGKLVTVKPYDWEILGYEVQGDKLEKVVLGNFKQLPLKIAYAITIHKSQGQTYTSANVSPDCFAPGQLYVALSRVEAIEGMSLEHDIHYNSLKTSSAVKKLYDNMIEVTDDFIINSAMDVTEDIVEEPKKTSVFDKVRSMSDEELEQSCYMYRSIRDNLNAYSPWCEEEEKLMIRDLESGLSTREVAQKHGRTVGAIRSRIKKINER